MTLTLRERTDRSQSGFGADLVEALTACAELINTGRTGEADSLRQVADVREFGARYDFVGHAADRADVARLRAHRARLDEIVTDFQASRQAAAIGMLNALLAETGATPQVVDHGGRGPHIHVSSPTAPLADRMAAHFAMALAELAVAGESERFRSCASPACSAVFVDLSRNRCRRYCDSRTCGNRAHVAAYRARRAAGREVTLG